MPETKNKNYGMELEWKKLSDKKPLAWENGPWDGARSDKVFVCTQERHVDVATMYEGISDGSEFCTFYDQNDFELPNVVYWAEIKYPF